ncbi:receptor-like protein EIX1 isoform X2 [Gastrolobium bilobum]|uniref:receptor-like protein EIX1 isoform X2 n=1 Tax=Gastrolobium bilobum TaxID=150636 RepID=UPI002AAFEC1D|nr:receptor-like protein EIX1 isoform X2 [Gastrolobium bilobum]
MLSFRFILFCVVAILCMCFCVGTSQVKKCVETERQALLKLKDGFIHGTDFLSSWQGEDCCTWEGISCDNLTGHVTILDFQFLSDYSAGLGGKLDSSICELQHLTSTDLSSNNLEEKIPNCIGSLGQLIELHLERNRLVSAIPPTMGNLSKLQTLDLSYNEFVGVVPPTLGNLCNLQTLVLAHNEFDGVIPPTLGNLSNLQTLDLSYNDLVSNDLEWVSHLSNLRYLYLSNTTLFGVVDLLSSISKIPSLLELYLNWCGLGQVNPKSIPHLNSSTSLGTLGLAHNELNSSTLSWMLNVSKVLTHLYLSGNELEGIIPQSFQNLGQLKELWLNSNKLSGPLSDHIQNLGSSQNNLELLDLSDNPFRSGQFPDFSWLSSLQTLSLRNTNIVGSLPQSFGHLPFLAYLDLSFNQLSGSLPLFKVTELTSLTELHLSHNRLNGTVPYIIGQLSSLKILYLSTNEFIGNISEAHLSNLYSLRVLNVAHNSISFNLSSNWIPPFQLSRLYASSCILGPKFPAWLKHQRELKALEIYNSGISDLFPQWFWDLSSGLVYLNVSHNRLSGVLPKSLPISRESTFPRAWDFSFNNLIGSLPSFPESINILVLSNNMFSESLSSFCAMPPRDLTILDLSSNLLAGPLSDCWGEFHSLEFLNLANNNFSGKIPHSFGTLRYIQSMHFNNNNFSGALPTWVGHDLHDLIVLRLRANKFHGNIPASLCNLLFLQVLDLSQNNFTGEIPQCLGHIIALSNTKFPRKTILYTINEYSGFEYTIYFVFIDEATLSWKGKDRKYGKILGLMTSIDLSCNHLTGEIPQSITMLVALVGLNLSGNNLTGFIPNNIGHMQMLESLDLSRNHLYGRMPSSFSNLSFLSYMNLSFNNLSGKIPVSTQLQSFDASTYEGNSGLCGPPLTNHCLGDVISPSGSSGQNGTNEDKDELITFGFYISLGLGFCVGFWAVCGTLLVKTSWRHAYFQFMNNMCDWMYVSLAMFAARMKMKFKVQE